METGVCAWCRVAPATGDYQSYPICTNCYYGGTTAAANPVPNVCKTCGQILETGQITCKHCDRSPVRKEPASPLFNPCWCCSNCHYEYNLTEKCLKCAFPHVSHQPKASASLPIVSNPAPISLPTPAPTTSIPALIAPIQAPIAPTLAVPKPAKQPQGQWSCYQSGSTGWNLWGCAAGHTMNTMQDLVCRTCDLVSAHPDASGLTADFPGNSKEAAAPWVCFACGKQSTGKRQCVACGCLRTWAGYLQASGIELNRDESRWKCALCGEFNALEEGVCLQCRKNEPVILKWALPQKQGEQPKAYSCCCCAIQ
jgi:hypothetical protein